MENASKALIMAASILIGVMLLSLMIYCFSLFADYAKDYADKQDSLEILQFNSQFSKYNNQEDPEINIDAYDMVDIVTKAQNYNTSNDLVYGDNGYVQVYISKDGSGNYVRENATKDDIQNFLKSSLVTDAEGNVSVKKYRCVTFQVSQETGKVYFLLFAPKTD